MCKMAVKPKQLSRHLVKSDLHRNLMKRVDNDGALSIASGHSDPASRLQGLSFASSAGCPGNNVATTSF